MTEIAKTPEAILLKYWGFTKFRGSQELVIRKVLQGEDVLALMRTGGGKSLCYQLPALCLDGIVIVVSPLIALMQDQVAKLREKGIKAMALSGKIRRDAMGQILDNAAFGNYKILYLSPERLKQEWILRRLGELNVSMIAIDEAHCISQWGHDFRPSYLECAQLRTLHPNAPILALTATATEQVIQEIIHYLDLKTSIPVKDSFQRPNLTYEVMAHHNKRKAMVELIRKCTNSCIVYVRTRRETHVLAELLLENGIKAVYYHGGLEKERKEEAMKGWLADKAQVMVATTAFGMGIDKADVGLVIHFAIPESIASYFQEAGRAGRNGNSARAVLLYAPVDIDQARQQFTASLPGTKDIQQLYKLLVRHLQIPFGEGADETFPFDFQEFCTKYALPYQKTYEGLKTLDRLGIVLLSEHFHQKTTFKYIVSKEVLWSYFDKQPELRTFHETMVRSYGGIFDQPIPLNIYVLAKRMGCTIKDVKQHLKLAHKDEVAEVMIQESDLNLTFVLPREDDHTILPYKNVIESTKSRKETHLEDMIRYIAEQKKCRAAKLLAYFGETLDQECGRCDVCRQKTTPTHSQIENRKGVIMELLQHRLMTLSDIHNSIGKSKAEALQCVQELLEDEKIAVNAKNQYYTL